MRRVFSRDGWRSRRVVLPAVGLLFIATGGWVGWSRSSASRLVFYNETGTTLPEVTLAAGRRSVTFQELMDGDSVRWRLSPDDGAHEVSVATNGAVVWKGAVIGGESGERWIVRLRPDGEAESTRVGSCWQRLAATLGGSGEEVNP